MQELKQGTPLQGGRYIIKRVLGQGGFGITYLAEQVSLGRDVAIKEFFMADGCQRDADSGHVMIPSDGSAARVKQFRKKFRKEARTLAGLDHPHIIGVIDVFEENGTVYYSMPYMPNGSLRSLVGRRGRLPEADALHYIGQVASALQYMHDRRLCHYDVKPDNILLDNRDNAVLIDFGISKNYDLDGKEVSDTPIGISDGYTPIEQYQGIKSFSPASDIYALGATLYYLIMGQTPPKAAILTQGVELVIDTTVSDEIRCLITSAMQIKASARPQDMAVFMIESPQSGRQMRLIEDALPVSQNTSTQTTHAFNDSDIETRFKTRPVLLEKGIDGIAGNPNYLAMDCNDFCQKSTVRFIYIKNTCIKDIYNMCSEDRCEPNNLLMNGCMVLGQWRYNEESNEYYVSLEKVVKPGDDAVRSEYEFNFGSKVKLKVGRRLRKLRRETGLQYDLTCWVTFRPGLGVFLSNQDKSVHQQLSHPNHPCFLTAMVIDNLKTQLELGIFTFKPDGTINSKADLTQMYSLQDMYKWAVESESIDLTN